LLGPSIAVIYLLICDRSIHDADERPCLYPQNTLLPLSGVPQFIPLQDTTALDRVKFKKPLSFPQGAAIAPQALLHTGMGLANNVEE
jgi:hypothetical protein